MDHPTPDPLALPVGALMRPAASVAPEDSLALAGTRLRESGVGVIGVIDGQTLVGSISEPAFARTLAEGVDLCESCRFFATPASTIHPYESGAQALRLMTNGNLPALLVVDDHRRLMGVVTPTDLMPRRRPYLQPPTVGGMATPFGVYLTTGTVHAGAKWYGLVASGMTLFTLLLAAQMIAFYVGGFIVGVHSPLWLQNSVGSVLTMALFFLGMRLIPLSGTHAAEHQVVHAIERGEELIPQIVRRMPRVHPRCGTNLAVGMGVFLGLSSTSIIANDELRLLLALVVTVATWRPLGSLLQYYVTTKPATNKQLESGIRAGKELLEVYSRTRVITPSIPLRLWNSGIFHVMTGSLIMYGVVAALSLLFHWDVAL